MFTSNEHAALRSQMTEINNANILVTGGCGFMGSSFIRYVLQDTHFQGKIFNLDALKYSGNIFNLTAVDKDKRYHFVHGNILDKVLLQRIIKDEKIQYVVHFAAESHVDRSIKDAKAFVETNVLGTFTLLDVCKDFEDMHFHHISTDEVYGSIDSGRSNEKSNYAPSSPYSASKASSDYFVHAYAKTYGLSTTITHANNNYGPCQFPEKLIPFMILNCLKKQPMPIYGDGQNKREWLFVEDHSRAVWFLLCNKQESEIFNIASEDDISNLSLVEKLIEIFADITHESVPELRALIQFVQDRPGHDFRYALDGSKLFDLGYKPRVSLEKGLRETIRWYLNNPDWIARIETQDYHGWLESQYAGVFDA